MILYLLLLQQAAAALIAQDDPPSLITIEELQDLNIEFSNSTCNTANSVLTPDTLPTFEGCCPTTGTSCEDLGGHCYWYQIIPFFSFKCDHIVNNLCGHPGCLCCIRCNEDAQSQCSDNDGVCRARCKKKQFEANYLKCESCLCKCCQKCDQTDQCTCGDNKRLPGECVGDENSCGSGHYITQDCNPKQPCHCCRKCKPGKVCQQLGGYCERRGMECEQGHVEHECGCKPSKECICCIPEDAPDCTEGPGCTNGYCTTQPCPSSYMTTSDFVGTNPECHCCKKFVMSEGLQPLAPIAPERQEQIVNINIHEP